MVGCPGVSRRRFHRDGQRYESIPKPQPASVMGPVRTHGNGYNGLFVVLLA